MITVDLAIFNPEAFFYFKRKLHTAEASSDALNIQAIVHTAHNLILIVTALCQTCIRHS